MPHNIVEVSEWLWAALACLAALNVAVCIAAARSGNYTRAQVVAQSFLVWLVPMIGAIVVGIFLFSERDKISRNPLDTPPADGLVGIGGDINRYGAHHAP